MRIGAILVLFGLISLLPACTTGGKIEDIGGYGGGQQSSGYEYEAYYVKKGDTLYSLGNKFDVSWGKIQRVNQCSPDSLKVGQLLLIPVGGKQDKAEKSNEVGSKGTSSYENTGGREDLRPGVSRGREGKWWWPVQGEIAYEYDSQVRGFREPGIGILTKIGTPVIASRRGEVLCVIHRGNGVNKGWGNVVAIAHPDGFVSWYGYLGSIYVEERDKVDKGEKIARVGKSGAASNSCLAFRLFKNERPVNPLRYLK